MNTVLEALFLRRPRIEYISPPVCPIHFSASGVAIFDQCFHDQSFCSLGKVNSNFLHFEMPSDALAFNIYYSTQQSGQPFTIVNDGVPLSTAVVFTAGTYWFTVNLENGNEVGPFPPVVADGIQYFQLSIPKIAGGVSVNLYRNNNKIVSGITGVIVESSAQGWYQATKITADGESSLQDCQNKGGGPVLLSGSVPQPPPPPPPPPPGPDWNIGFFGADFCLGCEGDLLNGTPDNSGHVALPGSSFSLHTQLHNGSFFEYTRNMPGSFTGNYDGPAAHCRITTVGGAAGPGAISGNNIVSVFVDGIQVVSISGAAMYAATNHVDFNIPSGHHVVQVAVQGQAGADQNLNVSGSFSNIL
jgi:hypothetical protein